MRCQMEKLGSKGEKKCNALQKQMHNCQNTPLVCLFLAATGVVRGELTMMTELGIGMTELNSRIVTVVGHWKGNAQALTIGAERLLFWDPWCVSMLRINPHIPAFGMKEVTAGQFGKLLSG